MEVLDFSIIYTLIKEEALVILPFLWVVGVFLKNTTIIKNKYIPLILLCISIFATIQILGFNIHAVIQGFYIAGVAIFGHQFLKQRKKEE